MTGSRATSLQGARVLVLEDEFFIADDLARALREKGAEPVGPVSTVKEAEVIVAEGRLDAAILDLNLHGEMASDLVGRLLVAKVSCLIVSGYAEDALPQSVSYVPRLEKPVSPASVIECLAAELARADRSRADRARFPRASARDGRDA